MFGFLLFFLSNFLLLSTFCVIMEVNYIGFYYNLLEKKKLSVDIYQPLKWNSASGGNKIICKSNKLLVFVILFAVEDIFFHDYLRFAIFFCCQ
jgi:hypothetical protein